MSDDRTLDTSATDPRTSPDAGQLGGFPTAPVQPTDAQIQAYLDSLPSGSVPGLAVSEPVAPQPDPLTVENTPEAPATLPDVPTKVEYTEKYPTEDGEGTLPAPDTELTTDDAVQFLQEFLSLNFGQRYAVSKIGFILAKNAEGYDAYKAGE